MVRRQGLVVDAHIGASGAEGNALQSEANFSAVHVVDCIDKENLAVGAVLQGFEATFFVLRESGCRFPRASGVPVAHVVENIEEASAGNAAREHHTAVGEFFDFGFVAGRCGRSMNIAQGVPRAAEVVAVDHAVAAGACAEGRVESVVTTHFHELTLANASAAEEHRVDRPEMALVEK